MHNPDRPTTTSKASAASGAKSGDDLELVEVGPGKLVLTKVGGDEIPGEQSIDIDDLQIVGADLSLDGSAGLKPEHDPYNSNTVDRADMWYRVSRKKD